MDLLKRLTALALAGVLSLGLLTGCAQEGAASSSASASASTSAEEPEQSQPLDLNTIGDVCTYLTGLDGDEVVATADDIEITVKELIYWLGVNADEMLSYYYYYYGMTELPWDTMDDAGETSLGQFIMAEAMKYALLQRLMEKKGAQEGYEVSPEDQKAIQESLESMREEAAAQGVTAEQILWEQGLTPELYVWNYECDYLYQAIAEALFGAGSPNPPTEESVRQWKEQEGYYKVKHILRATIDTATQEALDEATRAEKKAQAEDLLNQLRQSQQPQELFDQLMNEHSEDPGLVTSPEGYEFQANTSIDPAFEAAALALEEGQISEIVEGVSGYHIILRLPLDVDLLVDGEEYKNTMMTELVDDWILEANMKKTPAFDKLDPQQIYDRLGQYREAVTALLEQNAPKE